MSKRGQDSSSMGFWIIGAIIVIAIVAVTVMAFKGSPSSKTTRELALTCTTDMATQFHIHPVLKIVVKGQSQELPANVGITSSCMMPLHTHDNTGIIHVESPEKRDFNLGDFFAVWEKDIRSFGESMKMTVNKTDKEDYENYVLKDKDEIVLIFD